MMNPLIEFKKANPIFLALTLACFGLSTSAQAASPPPDGDVGGANVAEGSGALFHLTTGTHNTAVGGNTLYSLTTGGQNTATGSQALMNNTANRNTADGFQALYYNTLGADNTATGWRALFHNTTTIEESNGLENTADGSQALYNNTVGNVNTAIGYQALFSNTTGGGNIADGAQALYHNTTGDDNLAFGYISLFYNRTGGGNIAIGDEALYFNNGDTNIAIGPIALFYNTTGRNNTAVGIGALQNNTTGSSNIAVGGGEPGFNVTTADNVICIGAGAFGANVSNTTWVSNIYGVTTQNGATAPVIVSADGQLGTVTSSERFKKDIATMNKASEAILSLRPVTFHYKTDGENTPQFGLIAEEVAKVNPALVLSDKEGKPYTVRYDAVNAMLLNEFLKAHRKMEEQDATIVRLEHQINALTAGLQKVSAQLELGKTAPQTVLNNH